MLYRCARYADWGDMIPGTSENWKYPVSSYATLDQSNHKKPPPSCSAQPSESDDLDDITTNHSQIFERGMRTAEFQSASGKSDKDAGVVEVLGKNKKAVDHDAAKAEANLSDCDAAWDRCVHVNYEKSVGSSENTDNDNQKYSDQKRENPSRKSEQKSSLFPDHVEPVPSWYYFSPCKVHKPLVNISGPVRHMVKLVDSSSKFVNHVIFKQLTSGLKRWSVASVAFHKFA